MRARPRITSTKLSYKQQVRRILSRDQHDIFSRLSSPTKIQNFLDSLPINFEPDGETNHSPATVLKSRDAHCAEGAFLAAAALAYHGHKPLVMDLATDYDDDDHMVALFKEGRYWGAISKTNHPILRFRDPIYESPRELAMSYVHEYVMKDGRKSMRAFSEPFDLSKFAPEKWVTSEESLDWLMEKVSRSKYHWAIPPSLHKKLRRASLLERRAFDLTEWQHKT